MTLFPSACGVGGYSYVCGRQRRWGQAIVQRRCLAHQCVPFTASAAALARQCVPFTASAAA
jgi:hypothetical protein